MSNRKDLEHRIEALKAGDHLCCIYETDEEHRILLTTFMKHGLQLGEKIIYVVDVRTAEDILESYMSGGIFDPDGMIALLKKETERALEEGYATLRVTGEMSWALRGLPGSDRLLEYETKLNEFFPDHACMAICQYDRRRFDSEILLDILLTHPIAVIGTQLFDNFYYIAPGDLQGPDPHTARLNNRLQNLRERKRTDEALARAYDELENKVQERTKELARANEQLRKNQQSLSEAQRIAHLGNWDWNIMTNELVWSDEIFRIFGLIPGKFGATFESFLASVHPGDRRKVKNAVDKALVDPNYQYSIEHRVARPDASTRIVHENGEVTFDQDNKPVRMIGTVQDITDRKKMEQKLAQQLAEINVLKQKLESENIYLRKEIKLQKTHETIIGKSRSIMQVLSQIEQVAPTDSVVLIQGETGTGKELVAQSIHNLSSRKKQVMVKVNCAAIPAPLIESELFGREKGAYTGALSRQIGRFELANDSTIFLDEVGELSLELQAKLLRVLQEGAFERLGSPKTIKVDVRIIAASNRNLRDEIARKRFREDLFYRLNVFPIQAPPLRERTEDIPLLVWNFVNEFAEKMNKEIHHISHRSMDALQAYHWPGNIRELRNVIEHAVIISTKKELQISLPAQMEAAASGWQTLEENEYGYITRVLEKTNWRIKGKSGAAALLGLKPSTLYAKMNKLAIPTKRIKDQIET
jgi:formate hydrogenlyase transcriptional activator